ncbi:transposase [Streptomyces sp. KHY 26]
MFHQLCWDHKIANVLDALPKSAQPGAKKALQEICSAEVHDHALLAAAVFEKTYGAEFPRPPSRSQRRGRVAGLHFPAEQWLHLHTTNPPSPRSPPSACARGSPRRR